MVKPTISSRLFLLLPGLAIAGAVCLVSPRPAEAISAFARAYEMPCSACHSAWPSLNSFGRQFKENGYMVARGQPQGQTELNDYLSLPTVPPVAVVLNSRPYDRQKDRDAKLQALHEFEVMVAGNFSKFGSFFSELEMEDANGFDPELAAGWAGLHLHQMLNVVGGAGPAFTADPYNTLRDSLRLTRGRPSIFEKGTAAGAPRLRDNEQFVSAYGRDPIINKIFYLFSYAADRDDPEGEGAQDLLGRLAIDLLPELTIGGFAITGRQSISGGEEDQDFQRWGVDGNLELAGLTLRSAWLRAEDDGATGLPGMTSQENDVFYGEVFYTLRGDLLANLPVPLFQVVPLLRIDSYEKNDGDNDETDLTANLGVYVTENFRANFEYFTSLDHPAERRVTLFFILAI